MSSSDADQTDAGVALVPPSSLDQESDKPEDKASQDDRQPEKLEEENPSPENAESQNQDTPSPESVEIPIEEETAPAPASPTSSEKSENPDGTPDPQPSSPSPPTTPSEPRGETSFDEEPLLPQSPPPGKKSDDVIFPALVDPKSTDDGRGASNNLKPKDSSSNKRRRSRMPTSLEDIGSLRLWKGIVAEFLGTLVLTLVGCGSCVNLQGDKNVTNPTVQIALCFGLSVASVVWAICHVSGGHINPAVTVAMLATRKISIAKAVFFVMFQLIGAVVGAGILFGLTPASYQGNLGCTLVSDKLTPGQGFGVEVVVTFVLVFVVFASCDNKRKDLNGSTPLTIGLSVTMCHLFAIDYTGSSMNTARSFGPALVMGKWEHHWVYWAGPILGGLVAGILYDHLFAVNASLVKAKACLLSSGYDNDRYHANKIKVRIIEEDPEEDDGQALAMSEKDSDPCRA